ncbi:beta-ketoacyl-ACP synthase III [Streptomyces sp. NPDC001793]|uniref:beta-ketoacyl-ACP synthase III n=1 Tax=Streptomyces sp. NPDC001793 TaxID=3154657 RepID=UPI00331734FE
MRQAALVSIGSYVPPRRVSNDEICQKIDSSDEWIRTRTGIQYRHVADNGMVTSDLGAEAGERALTALGSRDIDMVIVSTATGDNFSPPTAPVVAHKLGLGGVPTFDVSAACSGFVFGLATTAGMVRGNLANRVLFVSAETPYMFTDPHDRNTAPLFGDGAGAVVVAAETDPDAPGVIGAFDLGTDGSGIDLVKIPGHGSRARASGALLTESRYITMNGRELFVQAVTSMERSSRVAVAQAGLSLDDIDIVIAHQANRRIIEAVADELEMDRKKFFINIGDNGNTLSASIPLALKEASDCGVLAAGHRVLITAFGSGTSWGSTVITWPDLPTSSS